MFVRVTRTVNDRGVLVRPQDVDRVVTDPQVDWYRSAYTYGEDAKTYWEAHEESIKGYQGETYTSSLWFDLDSEVDPSKAKRAAVDLLEHFDKLGWINATEIFFSGFKGFHVILHTTERFVPSEVSLICYNLAKEAKIPAEVFDTSVYNVTRIFRIPNTRHQKSGLYKVPITLDELRDLKLEKVKEIASEPRYGEFDISPANGIELKARYATKIEASKKSETTDEETVITSPVDLGACPPGHRRCIYALEQGDIGPGQRHDAILRLAAFYKGQGYSREHAGEQVYSALEKRHEIYLDANQVDKAECERDIDQIYSKDWKGGLYTCRTDIFLQQKCDHGQGPCFNDARVKMRSVMNFEQLYHKYVKYGEEALIDYPKFGIQWIDERVRLRPRNFSVLAGANGSGKTSIMFELMESLNNQKIYHAFFSLDMADSSVFEKIGAKYTQYSQRQIEAAFNINTKNSIIMKEVLEAGKKNMPYTLIDFTSAATLQYIEQTVMALKQIYDNLQVVMIDYAGRLIGEFENQYASSTQNAMTANDVAKRTNCHFIYLAQVSRENGDHIQALRSSRVSKDSGAWEENATAVMTCWRPLGDGINGNDKYIHIYIAKNRSGPLGENVFSWDGKTGKVKELRQDEFDEYCVELESLGQDRPRFSWFEDRNDVQKISDDIPVADRGRSAGRFGNDSPKIRPHRMSPVPASVKPKPNVEQQMSEAIRSAPPAVRQLAEEQRKDDTEEVPGIRPFRRPH